MENGKKYFYVDGSSNEVSGPNSLEELKRFQFASRISMDTQVAEGGTENWMSFGEILRLAAADVYKSTAEKSAKKWFKISIILAIVGILVPPVFWVAIEVMDVSWEFFAEYPFIRHIINLLAVSPALFFILLYQRQK